MRMETTRITLARGVLALGLCGLAASAQAQVGTGWTRYYPTKKIHLDNESGLQTFSWTSYKSVCSPICADYRYDSGSLTETFRLLDNRSNRSEIRLENNYTSGQRQFQGYVRVSSPTNDEAIMQVFGAEGGATAAMVRAFSSSGGSLRIYSGTTIATGVYGVWRRLNVIHDANANTIKVYVDGSLKWSGADRGDATHYFKYGAYGTLRTSSAKVEWRDTKFFRK